MKKSPPSPSPCCPESPLPTLASIYQIADRQKRRGTGDQTFTLQVPDFNIGEGEFVVVHGQSGCGKSTLLDILGLVLHPDSDREFTFHPARRDPVSINPSTPDSLLTTIRRREIGYILQTGGLLPFLTVRQNIELPRRINGMHSCREEGEHIARRLDIDSQLGKFPAQLSGGQRQRVAIARALVHYPPVILADEPTAAVDQLTAAGILEHLGDLIRELGVTLVLVTHHVEPVLNLASRFFTFRIERDGSGITSICHESTRPAKF